MIYKKRSKDLFLFCSFLFVAEFWFFEGIIRLTNQEGKPFDIPITFNGITSPFNIQEEINLTVVTKDNGIRVLDFEPERLRVSLEKKFENVSVVDEFKEQYINKTIRQVSSRETIDFRDINKIAINNALELVTELKDENDEFDISLLPNTNFQLVAKNILLSSLYKRASKNRAYDRNAKYGEFYGLLTNLSQRGLVHSNLLRDYSSEELHVAGSFIVPDRDKLLSYAALYHMSERYVIRDRDESRSIYELPQERYLMISLAINRKEAKETRMERVKELYDILSTLQSTMATPTFSNAGKPDGQFSSCFILTTEDSLRSIYDDNTDIATLSKYGGGIGAYFGKLRGKGSDIREHKGVSGGILGWIKQLNNTAVSVDQLGQRKGAIAVYLDIWHSDIVEFLELRLNTGDLAKRAHDIFTGVCLPDEFMRQVDKRGDWYLFDPYKVRKIMGFNLEDFYDEYKLEKGETPDKERHAWTYHYYQCVDNNALPKTRIPAISLMKKIMQVQLETGIPYMFYRDTVNRDNPNKHKGMIYSSNLCTEISQNQSPTYLIDERYKDEDGETIIVTKKKPGDFVTCNLSSLVLNNIIQDPLVNGDLSEADKERLKRVIRILVRATDNVISVNNIPVPAAEITNEKYRAIGIGEQGIAALLAKLKIPFDTMDAVNYVSILEERIMLYVIEASSDLGREKGSYPVFEGSGWNTGEWFKGKPLTLEDEWAKVIDKSSKYMRNGYLRAPAPTGSTSLLAGSTASIETVYDVVFQDGKKDSLVQVVAPELNYSTYYFYRPTVVMKYGGTKDLGHMWAVLQNEKRQVWIDQSSSSNIYVGDDISAVNFLRLHMEHWERGIKTSYYVRSHDASREDSCLGCSA